MKGAAVREKCLKRCRNKISSLAGQSSVADGVDVDAPSGARVTNTKRTASTSQDRHEAQHSLGIHGTGDAASISDPTSRETNSPPRQADAAPTRHPSAQIHLPTLRLLGLLKR